jgi:hypothetical protein
MPHFLQIFVFMTDSLYRLAMINCLSHRLGFTAHALGDFGLSRRMPAVFVVVFQDAASMLFPVRMSDS